MSLVGKFRRLGAAFRLLNAQANAVLDGDRVSQETVESKRRILGELENLEKQVAARISAESKFAIVLRRYRQRIYRLSRWGGHR